MGQRLAEGVRADLDGDGIVEFTPKSKENEVGTTFFADHDGQNAQLE
jgi:hypothetical protein